MCGPRVIPVLLLLLALACLASPSHASPAIRISDSLARAQAEFRRTIAADLRHAGRQSAANTDTDSIDGFTDKVNDGTGIFRPIRPGTRVPNASQFKADADSVVADDDESPQPSPSGDDDDSVCFPADATITLQLKDSTTTLARMDALSHGDRVMVAQGTFSPVIMFTHRLPAVRARFVVLRTHSNHSLALTPGHYVYVDGDRLVQAQHVVTGNVLSVIDQDGKIISSSVTSIESQRKVGLFNPQTAHGDIVVNGVRASTYTAAVEQHTAHALLAPVRAAHEAFGLSLTCQGPGPFKSLLSLFQSSA